MTQLGDDSSGTSPDTILTQVNRILASPLFAASKRSSTLLRFLVRHALKPESAPLKEYTIGAEGLGKGTSFDPRTDPVVRAEASRLRGRLEKYYATEGRTDSLLITLLKGAYIPQFRLRFVPKRDA